MRECVDKEGFGGALVRNGMSESDAAVSDVINGNIGNHGNLEVVLYNRDSIYGRVHTLRNSRDPVAVAIANQELLELLHLAPNIYDA